MEKPSGIHAFNRSLSTGRVVPRKWDSLLMTQIRSLNKSHLRKSGIFQLTSSFQLEPEKQNYLLTV